MFTFPVPSGRSRPSYARPPANNQRQAPPPNQHGTETRNAVLHPLAPSPANAASLRKKIKHRQEERQQYVNSSRLTIIPQIQTGSSACRSGQLQTCCETEDSFLGRVSFLVANCLPLPHLHVKLAFSACPVNLGLSLDRQYRNTLEY